MNLLALDLGTRCGWALCRTDAPMVSGVWNLTTSRYQGGGMRYLALECQLARQHAQNALDCVVVEEVRRHLGTDAAHVYGGMLAIVTAWCERQTPKIAYRGYPVQTIKKYATNKGNASKPEMLQAAFVLGYLPADDNEADAIHLARLAWEELGERTGE